jgi:hypothetical protein
VSIVTNVILTCSLQESDGDDGLVPAIAFLNNWLDDRGTLVSVRELAGGGKVMEAHVFLGAYNLLDVQGFLEAVRTTPWEDAECVRVFLQEQHEDAFRDAGVRL